MSKRSIIVCTVVAVLLLAGIGYLFCSLFSGTAGRPSEQTGSLMAWRLCPPMPYSSSRPALFQIS